MRRPSSSLLRGCSTLLRTFLLSSLLATQGAAFAQSPAPGLSESEAEALIAPLVKGHIISSIDTEATTLWTNGILADLAKRGCWKVDYAHERVGFIYLPPDTITESCRSILHSAVLRIVPDAPPVASQITVIASNAELDKIRSVQTREGFGEVQFNVVFRLTDFFKVLEERSPDAVAKGRLDWDGHPQWNYQITDPTIEFTDKVNVVWCGQRWRVVNCYWPLVCG